MAAVVTNVWSGWLSDPLARRHFSRVVVEACGELTGFVVPRASDVVGLVLPRAVLNLPPVVLPVHDGVIEQVSVRSDDDRVLVEVRLSEPAQPRLVLVPGTPFRAVLDFPASGLVKLFSGRLFVLDAGHGAADTGGLGPIDLKEKNVVLDMVLRLEKLIEQSGGIPVLTRRDDSGVSEAARARMVREAAPVAVVSLHTHASRDRSVKGFAVFTHNRAAQPLGELIRLNLSAKLGLPDRGVWKAAGPPFSLSAHQPSSADTAASERPGPPAVTVETVTISNPVEEGWLRSCVFRQRVAQGVFNGLASWLRVADSDERHRMGRKS